MFAGPLTSSQPRSSIRFSAAGDCLVFQVCLRRRLFFGALLTALLGGLGFGAFVALGLHPALAVVAPVPGAEVLVVEGWLPRSAMAGALAEFRRGGYERVYTIGVPYRSDFEPDAKGSHASSGAAKLRELGMPAEVITAVPSEVTRRNRSFLSALALRNHLAKEGRPFPAMNVVTQGAHGRRSRLCLQRAFGASVSLGVISVTNPDYEPERWWASSEGVKEVLGELLGFSYAWWTLSSSG